MSSYWNKGGYSWKDFWGYRAQIQAVKQNYSVVRDFCGHGIGKEFHTPPSVLHYGKLVKVQNLNLNVFTIEPMINLGDWRIKILNDGWTAVTKEVFVCSIAYDWHY